MRHGAAAALPTRCRITMRGWLSPASADVPSLRWRLQFGRGRAFEMLGRFEDALREFLEAVEVIERTRHQLSTDRARTGYLDDKREVYSALVRLLLRLNRPAEAFQVAERLRAEGYLELVTRSAALSGARPGAVPSDLLARIRHLQESIEHELRLPGLDRRGSALVIYRDELRTAEAEWARVVNALTAHEPWARALVADIPSAAAVQARLTPTDALVQFVVGDEETVAFVLRRHAIHAEILPLGARALRTRVELLRGLLFETGTSEWQAPSTRLDADLLQPAATPGLARWRPTSVPRASCGAELPAVCGASSDDRPG